MLTTLLLKLGIWLISLKEDDLFLQGQKSLVPARLFHFNPKGVRREMST
jgi:hypothetical protein